MLEIAYELESIKGEDLEWNRRGLGITNRAWNKVILVSQKSMSRVGLSINIHEKGKGQLNDEIALHVSKHLNKIISILTEHDEKIDASEFDLWRGMAAGSQAQGSWQNTNQ